MHVHLADVDQSENVAEPLLHSAMEIAYIGARNARTTLMAGFTTVHNVGNFRAFADVELRNAINRGDVIGPRISAVGAYVTIPGGGGEVTGFAPDVEVPADMRAGRGGRCGRHHAQGQRAVPAWRGFDQADRHRRGAGARDRTGPAGTERGGNARCGRSAPGADHG
jgi:imidazolonepropionase-like amidohydrolase